MVDRYGPPVDRLLQRSELPRFAGEWPDYLAEGFGPDDIPELIRMATDPELNEGETGSLEVWGSVHAWRTLGQLRAEAAVGPLFEMVKLLTDTNSDDWAFEELPIVLGMIGPAAIAGATSLLDEESPEDHDYVKMSVGRVLEEIGKRYPESCDECVAILSECLGRPGWNPPSVNGFLVSNLLDLGAKEAAGVIERAYAEDRVDDSIAGTWYDVWHELDLDGEPPPRTEPLYRLSFDQDDPDDERDGRPRPAIPRESWTPVELKTPEERKDRNKARQKLEKKIKGKKGKK